VLVRLSPGADPRPVIALAPCSRPGRSAARQPPAPPPRRGPASPGGRRTFPRPPEAARRRAAGSSGRFFPSHPGGWGSRRREGVSVAVRRRRHPIFESTLLGFAVAAAWLLQASRHTPRVASRGIKRLLRNRVWRSGDAARGRVALCRPVLDPPQPPGRGRRRRLLPSTATRGSGWQAAPRAGNEKHALSAAEGTPAPSR
jgi:hypothetical protein